MKTLYRNAYVLNVMSDDHPGIVAAVGRAVSAKGGNIDAISQTVLQGYFTLIMIISFFDPADRDALAEEIQAANEGYLVTIRPYRGPADHSLPEPVDHFVVTAFGEDKPNIIPRFSQYLAGKDINITDLYGDRKDDEFVLIGQVEVPKRWDIRHLQADLEEIGRELGFTVRLQHEDIFVATNQLRLSHHS